MWSGPAAHAVGVASSIGSATNSVRGPGRPFRTNGPRASNVNAPLEALLFRAPGGDRILARLAVTTFRVRRGPDRRGSCARNQRHALGRRADRHGSTRPRATSADRRLGQCHDGDLHRPRLRIDRHVRRVNSRHGSHHTMDRLGRRHVGDRVGAPVRPGVVLSWGFRLPGAPPRDPPRDRRGATPEVRPLQAARANVRTGQARLTHATLQTCALVAYSGEAEWRDWSPTYQPTLRTNDDPSLQPGRNRRGGQYKPRKPNANMPITTNTTVAIATTITCLPATASPRDVALPWSCRTS